jgi:hypothetical protein
MTVPGFRPRLALWKGAIVAAGYANQRCGNTNSWQVLDEVLGIDA